MLSFIQDWGFDEIEAEEIAAMELNYLVGRPRASASLALWELACLA